MAFHAAFRARAVWAGQGAAPRTPGHTPRPGRNPSSKWTFPKDKLAAGLWLQERIYFPSEPPRCLLLGGHHMQLMSGHSELHVNSFFLTGSFQNDPSKPCKLCVSKEGSVLWGLLLNKNWDIHFYYNLCIIPCVVLSEVH